MGVDKMGVDEMGVDEMGVDEMGTHRKFITRADRVWLRKITGYEVLRMNLPSFMVPKALLELQPPTDYSRNKSSIITPTC